MSNRTIYHKPRFINVSLSFIVYNLNQQWYQYEFQGIQKKPKLAISWWATVLGLLVLLEFPLLGIYSLIKKTLGAVELGPSVGIVGIIVTTAAVVLGTIAFKKGERSWVLWVGFGPALLLAVFWLFMIVAEIISAIFGLGF